MYGRFRKFFKKSFRRRGAIRRKRSFKRKYRKYKKAVFRPLVVKRYIKGTIALTSTSGGGAFVFRLADLPGYTEFVSMFDVYKIIKATVTLSPNCQPAEVGVPATGSNIVKAGGTFYWYKDFDDNGIPSGVTEVQQLPGRRQFLVTDQKVHKMTVYPAFSKQVFSSATSTGYGPGRGWLDLTYSDVPHYGIKWWWQPIFTDPINNYPVCVMNYETSITLALKDPR